MIKMKLNIFIFSLFFAIFLNAQNNVVIKGIVTDTSKKQNLQNVLVIASRLSDSILVGHSRTNHNGYFELNLPIDTFQISFYPPAGDYGEQIIFVLANQQNKHFDFGKIILPPKEHQLDEIIIYADREPVYYKGDTLVYIADSFKVKPDATVEDLLKKLPGIQVDKSGKIKVQGKEVDKVLVDGDEFFGTDPTIATKNLQAKQVENIQVYEQKNNDAAESNDKETLQVLNIQLKDEAKKGYFGKLYAGSDANKFYEAQAMFNRFNNKQKISLFAMSGNTPDFNLDWGDIDKYGLENEYENYYYDENEENFIFTNDGNSGYPQINKGGFYFNNKWNKVKLNTNYSFSQNILNTFQKENNQYFFQDSVYYTHLNAQSRTQSDLHKFNIFLNTDIDSLNNLSIKSNNTYLINKNTYSESKDFLNRNNNLFRTSNINTNANSTGVKTSNNIKFERKFHKKDRAFSMQYVLTYDNNVYDGELHNTNTYYQLMPILPDFNQKKKKNTEIYFHKIKTSFIEPFNKFFKTEITYEYQYSNGNSDWKTFNPNAQNDYVNLDSTFSNVFQPNYFQHLPSVGFNFNKSKLNISLKAKFRIFDMKNFNLFNQQSIHYTINNFLPYAKMDYKFNKTTNFSLNYNLVSQIPDLQKLQPILNNNNPNNIQIGNPDLLPTLEHRIRSIFYTYRPVSDWYFWCGSNYTFIERDFSNKLNYDNTGRSINQTINTNNNYSFGAFIGGTFNFFKKLLTTQLFYNYYTDQNQNIINNELNYTKTQSHYVSANPEINIEKEKYQWKLGIGYNFSYHIPYAALNQQTNQPYYTQNFDINTSINVQERYAFETDMGYTLYQNYAQGYNFNPLIWNASISAKVDKHKQLKIALSANDILNQNVNVQRNIGTNIITDKQVNIIRRYILLKITYNFSSQKNTGEDEE